jgi:hypothetical protein
MTATDFEQRKAGFLKQPLTRRLGNLAVNVKRIATHLDDATTKEGTLFWVTETRHFAEWTTLDAPESLRTDLAQLVTRLSNWESSWDKVWETPEQKSQMQHEATYWSDILFGKMDELLAVTL